MIFSYAFSGGALPRETRHQTVEGLLAESGADTLWIACDHLNAEEVALLGQGFGLHPGVMAELLHPRPRPRMTDHGGYSHLVLHAVAPGGHPRAVRVQQVHLLLWPGRVLTVCERPDRLFAETCATLDAEGLAAGDEPDMRLLHMLLQDMINGYDGLLDEIGRAIEGLEGELLECCRREHLPVIHELKSSAMRLRRALWPLRDNLSTLVRGGEDLFGEHRALRDIAGQFGHLYGQAETWCDMLSTLTDLYMTGMSNTTNDIMKVLTLVTSVFIPLSFLTGLYGMNFAHMPELALPWAYPALLAVMAAIVVGMLAIFRKKRWL